MPVSSFEMATRLSYFLWASAPDDELLLAAADDELSTPGGVELQVRRMLEDPRAKDAVGSFFRQWLGLDRVDEALEELRRLPAAPSVHATIAWLESRRGRLRPAITAMKRAFPEHVGEAGDGLPDEVWRILYPLEYRDSLERQARAEGLDPSLVAALICQESTFDAGAVSRVGARGLMQIMHQNLQINP